MCLWNCQTDLKLSIASLWGFGREHVWHAGHLVLPVQEADLPENRPCCALLYSCSQPDFSSTSRDSFTDLLTLPRASSKEGTVTLGSHLHVPLFGVLLLSMPGIPTRVLRMDRFPCYSRKLQIAETGHICVCLEISRIQGCRCVTGVAKACVSAVG